MTELEWKNLKVGARICDLLKTKRGTVTQVTRQHWNDVFVKWDDETTDLMNYGTIDFEYKMDDVLKNRNL